MLFVIYNAHYVTDKEDDKGYYDADVGKGGIGVRKGHRKTKQDKAYSDYHICFRLSVAPDVVFIHTV